MKALPCHSCLVFPICTNRTLVDTIYACTLMKEFLFKAKSMNRLYNKVNSIFNIKINPATFKLIVDAVRVEEVAMMVVAKNLKKRIDKDICNEVIKGNCTLLFDKGKQMILPLGDSKKLTKLVKKAKVIDEITKSS